MENKLIYSLKDISVIIATYNRPEDLQITLNSFKKEIAKINEVIIVDQSTNHKSLIVVKKFKEDKIKYFHSNKPSLTLARNYGIKKLSRSSKITIFLDDDVTLDKNYFLRVLDSFNSYIELLGVGGFYFPKEKIENKFFNFVKRFFLIENRTKNDAKVRSVYGAGYPNRLDKPIKSDWIPGFNMAFKKEVFHKDKFDENFFRYGLGEDFEFTTRLNKRFPSSLLITPYAKITHRVSEIERMPKPKLAYMNHINHFYIQSKNFNDFKGIVTWIIAIFNISFFHLLNAIFNPNRFNLKKTTLHFKALGYSFKNIHKIRNGNLELPPNIG